MADLTERIKGPSPADVLRARLESGSTGRLVTTQPGGDQTSVYVMQGEILAAESSGDTRAVLVRLLNSGAVTPTTIERLEARLGECKGMGDLLFGAVPDDLVMGFLRQRFLENLGSFLMSSEAVQFQPLESIFVENIQVGHDSTSLLAEMREAVEAARYLLDAPDLYSIRPGDEPPTTHDEARLLDLVEGALDTLHLFGASPVERIQTASLIHSMAQRGILRLEPIPARPSADAPPEMPVAGSVGSDPSDLAADRASEAEQPTPAPVPDGSHPMGESEPVAVSSPGVEPTGRVLPEQEPRLDYITSPPPRRESRRKERDLHAERVVREVAAGFGDLPEVDVPTDQGARRTGFGRSSELDVVFTDQEDRRGDGVFMVSREHLDYVDLGQVEPPRRVQAARENPREQIIEAEDADSARDLGGRSRPVSLSFTSPLLSEEEISHKIGVTNGVLREICHTLDHENGTGSGQAVVQLLLEGAPASFGGLFSGVEARRDGSFAQDQVVKNLRKRAESERRSFLNQALQDLINRGLSVTSETVSEERMDAMLERIAGFQHKMGI